MPAGEFATGICVEDGRDGTADPKTKVSRQNVAGEARVDARAARLGQSAPQCEGLTLCER
jgi:hypothetical protein